MPDTSLSSLNPWTWIQKRAARIIAERLNRDLPSYRLRTRNNMENLKRVLQCGDVILVEGNKLISRVIMAVTHSTWSHSALYIGNGEMIDPLPSTGTVISKVEVLKDLNIRVCRPMDVPEELRVKVCQFALSHLGRRYDHLNVSNILFAYFRRNRDHTQFLGDISQSSEVCSGLIAEAYNQIGFTILEGVNFSQIVPGDYDLSPNFEVVKFNRPRKKDVATVWQNTSSVS
jgi:uncharacterized protein YycO